MNPTPHSPHPLRRVGIVLVSALLLIGSLAACNRGPAGLTPVTSDPVVILAGALVEVPLEGTFAADASVGLVNPVRGLFVSLDTAGERATLKLSAALDIAAADLELEARITSAGSSRVVVVPVSIRELLVVTGSLSREAAQDVESASVAGGGIFRQLADDFGSIDTFLDSIGGSIDPLSERSRGLSSHLQGFIRVLAGESGVEDEYVVAIDAAGNVLGSAAADPFDGAWRMSIFLDAVTAAGNPQIALLRGRGADADELEQGGVDIVCIEPLEVAELDDNDVFKRTRRTRAALLRYISEQVAFQSDSLDPTRRVRIISLGALTANDQSGKMANADPSLFEASDPGEASPFYDADGQFRAELLACGAAERSTLEFELDLTLEESDDVFRLRGETVTPADTLTILALPPRAPSFDAGISFDLPAGGALDPSTPALSSTGVNESADTLGLASADLRSFPVSLMTPVNRGLLGDLALSNEPGSLRTLFGFEEEEEMLPIGLDACVIDINACDFAGGVTPIVDFAALAGLFSAQRHEGGLRVQSTATLGRIDIRGRLVNSSGSPIASQTITANCFDTALALGRTSSTGAFVLTVMEDLSFPLRCTVIANSRSGSVLEVINWATPAPGTLLIDNPLVAR
jgi:hypothetical protein